MGVGTRTVGAVGTRTTGAGTRTTGAATFGAGTATGTRTGGGATLGAGVTAVIFGAAGVLEAPVTAGARGDVGTVVFGIGAGTAGAVALDAGVIALIFGAAGAITGPVTVGARGWAVGTGLAAGRFWIVTVDGGWLTGRMLLVGALGVLLVVMLEAAPAASAVRLAGGAVGRSRAASIFTQFGAQLEVGFGVAGGTSFVVSRGGPKVLSTRNS